jgi:hypothetical protein
LREDLFGGGGNARWKTFSRLCKAGISKKFRALAGPVVIRRPLRKIQGEIEPKYPLIRGGARPIVRALFD